MCVRVYVCVCVCVYDGAFNRENEQSGGFSLSVFPYGE